MHGANRPARKLYTPRPRSDADDRPTVPAPFDVEAFARRSLAPDSGRASGTEPVTRRHVQLKEPEPDSASALLHAISDSDGPNKDPHTYDDRVAAMRESFSFGDYAGALVAADLVLASRPDDGLAREIRAKCCTTLEDVYALRLGPLDRVPVVVMLPEQADKRAIDHRTGFLLSLIDGSSTLDTIVDVCAMPRLDALRVLSDLVQRGIVGFESFARN